MRTRSENFAGVRGDTASRTLLELVITEGRNRQVRRMLQAVGSGVLELRRTALGPLSLVTVSVLVEVLELSSTVPSVPVTERNSCSVIS